MSPLKEFVLDPKYSGMQGSFEVLWRQAEAGILERWLRFREEEGSEQRHGWRQGGQLGRPAGSRPGGMGIRMGSWRQCPEWRQILEGRPTGLGDALAKGNGGGAEWGWVCWEDRENSI